VNNRPPKVVLLAVDLHENLVQMPPPAARLQGLDPPLLDLGREHRTETKPPISDRFVANVDAALVEQILNVPKREWEPDVQHHRQANDLRARLEVLEGGMFCHLARLRNRPPRLKPSSSDRATNLPISGIIENSLNAYARANL